MEFGRSSISQLFIISIETIYSCLFSFCRTNAMQYSFADDYCGFFDCVYNARSEPFFSESMLLAACKLSCSVYINGLDDPSYVRTVIGDTAVFAFRGALYPHVLTSTATEYGECQINNVGCLECMKDENNHPASVHQGALNQFLYISNNSSVQEEVLTIPIL